jgi:hypothetical protein
VEVDEEEGVPVEAPAFFPPLVALGDFGDLGDDLALGEDLAFLGDEAFLGDLGLADLEAFLGLAVVEEEEEDAVVGAFLVVVRLALAAFLGLEALDEEEEVEEVLAVFFLAGPFEEEEAALFLFVDFLAAPPPEDDEDDEVPLTAVEEVPEVVPEEEEEDFLEEEEDDFFFLLALRFGLSLYEALTLTKDEPSPRLRDCLICLRACSKSILKFSEMYLAMAWGLEPFRSFSAEIADTIMLLVEG